MSQTFQTGTFCKNLSMPMEGDKERKIKMILIILLICNVDGTGGELSKCTGLSASSKEVWREIVSLQGLRDKEGVSIESGALPYLAAISFSLLTTNSGPEVVLHKICYEARIMFRIAQQILLVEIFASPPLPPFLLLSFVLFSLFSRYSNLNPFCKCLNSC